MNIEALRHSFSASPAAPHGLEMSGPESDFQQLAETARNADNIVLWQRVWDRVKFYANEKGLEGSTIRNRTLELIGGFTLIAAAACGGGDVAPQVSRAPVPTPATGEAINLTPNATVVTTPEAKAAVPVAAVTEAPKVVIPEDAQKILNDFSSISVFKPEENEAIAKDFTAIWSDAKTDFQKYDSYSRLYGILWAKFNITKDPAVLLEMNKVEQTIAQKWPVMYQSAASHNGFYKDPGK